ncbi:MAG: hypothetical protein BMS9Abin11_1023 [Gammaproteobacteria bacterium]|nr:MAG: hypothetical protein BMS9Abin11_1023 [Gammaproteobacteria bacterium]
MTTIRIKDAPFTVQEKNHLLSMGIEEADWGHPEIILDNPVEYFRERVRLKDDPSMQISKSRKHLPRLRGTRSRPSDMELRRINIVSGPR